MVRDMSRTPVALRSAETRGSVGWRLIPLAAALVLTGCTSLGPDFKPPKSPTGRTAQAYALEGERAPSGVHLVADLPASGPWWQAFGSPELDATIRLALSNNPSIAEIQARLEKAQAEGDAADGARGPRLDASGRLENQRFNSQAFGLSGFPNHTFSLYSVGAMARYDLDVFGGGRRSAEDYRARAERAGHQADAAKLALTGNVALEAIKIARLQAQIDAVKALVASDRSLVEMMRQAKALGKEVQPSVNRAIFQMTLDEDQLPGLERDIAASRHRLAILAGQSPASWTPPTFSLASLKVPTDIPVSLPSDLVRHRPDILAAEADLHAATAAVGVSLANQYPDIQLTADLTQAALKPQTLFNYDGTGWTLLGNLTAPVLDSGVRKARTKGAQADLRAAGARYQQTVLAAFGQVADLLSALKSDQTALMLVDRETLLAEGGVDQATTGQRLGSATRMNVIEAQRQVSLIQDTKATAESRRLSDMVSLYTATAADWRGL